MIHHHNIIGYLPCPDTHTVTVWPEWADQVPDIGDCSPFHCIVYLSFNFAHQSLHLQFNV